MVFAVFGEVQGFGNELLCIFTVVEQLRFLC